MVGQIKQPGLSPLVVTNFVVAPAYRVDPIVPLSTDWIPAFEQPVRLKAGLSVAQQQFTVIDPNPRSSIFWFKEMETPVRVRPALPASSQHFGSDVGPVVPIVSFSWIYPWGNPVQLPKRLIESAQQTFDNDHFPRVSFSWMAPLNEPVRLKPRLAEALQQFLAPSTQPVVSFSWIYPWHDPVKIKPKLDIALHPFMSYMGSVRPEVPFSWVYAWVDPVKLPRRLSEALQQFLAPSAQPVVSFSWFEPLEQPVRLPLGITPAQQRAFVSEELPLPSPPSFGYFTALNDPVRLKVGLGTPLHPFMVSMGPISPVVSFSWIYGFEQPVRAPLRLPETEQSNALQDPQPFVPFSWIYAWIDPVRLKPGISAAQQPSEPTPFVAVYYPYAVTGPLYGSGIGKPNISLWKGRKT